MTDEKTVRLSLVVPCYNEQDNVVLFYNECKRVFEEAGISHNLIFVNDGSRDNTIGVLKELYQTADNITVVGFSRNFGKEAAMRAGLDRADGEYTVFIDADLQQRPETVVEMVRILDGNPDIDCVGAYQESRHEGKVTAFCKERFYRFINRVSDVKFRENVSDFRTFRKNVADAIRNLPEYQRFTKGIFAWVGFNTKFIPYVASERNAGETSWSFMKLVKYSIEGITNYSTVFLKIPTTVGGVTCVLSLLWLIVRVILSLVLGETVLTMGFLLGVILFLSGMQFLFLGAVGLYLSKLYVAQKGRPIYVVREDLSPKNRAEMESGWKRI